MKVSRILTGLYSLVYGDWKNESEDHPSCQWLLTLVKAASALLSAQDAERELLLKLVALGRSKKAQSFLGRSSRRPPPVFGLTNYDLLVSTLSNLEDCVNVLRHAALRCFKSQLSSQVIIRYYTSHGIPEYCTGLPHDEQSESTRSYNRALKALPLRPWRHLKWITDEFESPAKHSKLPAVMETVERIFKANSGMRSIPPGSLVWDFEDGNPFSSDLGLGKLHDEPESSQWKGAKRKQEFDTCTPGPVMRSMKKNKYEAASADVEIEDPTPSSVKIVEPEEVNVDDAESTKSRKETYKLFVGASSRAGLFVHEDLLKMYTSDNPFIGVLPQYAPLDVLEKALELDLLDAGRMRFALEAAVNKAPTHGHEDFAVSLAALGLATSAYANLGEASISPRVVAKPLCSAKWLGRGHGSAYKTLTELGSKTCMTREETFSCIAYLDYGLDIELQAFKNVMAISCGDSIYVASALLRDPLDQEDSRPVRRIIGNVGKPGLALLVPPANPRCLEVRAEDWKLINCEAYKGKPADNFGGTSLSLSFTNWRIPVELRDAERGRQDIEAYTYETLISVFEKGKWIADLDVLDALSKGHFIRGREWFYKVGCKHVEDTSSTPGVFIPASVDDGVNIDLGSRESQAEFVNSHLQDLAAPNTPEEVADIDPEMGEPLDEVVTINSWEEFLDHPSGPAIVMAHKNWPARLAAAALAVRRHDRVFVAEEFCWQCLTEIKGYGEDKFVKNSVFIC